MMEIFSHALKKENDGNVGRIVLYLIHVALLTFVYVWVEPGIAGSNREQPRCSGRD